VKHNMLIEKYLSKNGESGKSEGFCIKTKNSSDKSEEFQLFFCNLRSCLLIVLSCESRN